MFRDRVITDFLSQCWPLLVHLIFHLLIWQFKERQTIVVPHMQRPRELPLHYLPLNLSCNIFFLLLKAKCSFFSLFLSKANVHSSPLGIAAEKGHTEIVERLISAAALIDYQDKV